MPVQPERKLSDAELDRLARALFAEVRAQHPHLACPVGDAAGDVDVDLLDWLLDGSDGDDGGDGDSGD